MIHFEVVSRIQWVKCIEKSHFQNYSNSFTSGKQHKSDLNFKLISNSLSIVFLLFSHWNSKLLLIEPSRIWRRHWLKQMICILWTNTKVSKNREHIEYYNYLPFQCECFWWWWRRRRSFSIRCWLLLQMWDYRFVSTDIAVDYPNVNVLLFFPTLATWGKNYRWFYHVATFNVSSDDNLKM